MTLKSKMAKKQPTKKVSKPVAKKAPARKVSKPQSKEEKGMECTCRKLKLVGGQPMTVDGWTHRVGGPCEQPAPKAEPVAAPASAPSAPVAESTTAAEGQPKSPTGRSRRTKAQMEADALATAHATLAAHGMVAVDQKQWEQFQHDEEFLDKAAGIPHVTPVPAPAPAPSPRPTIAPRLTEVCGFKIPEHRHPALPADVPYVLDDPKFVEAGVAEELAGTLAKWIDAKLKIKELEGLRDAWAEDAQVLMAVADAEVVGIDCYKVQIIPPDTYPHISIEKLRDLVPTSILEQATEQKSRKSYMRFDDMRKKGE